MSNLLNKATAKAEQLLHKHNNANNTTHTTASTTTPGHTTGHTTHTTTGDPTATTGGATYNHSTATPSTNAGPHNSNAANKLDPRVDSDLDGRAVHGAGANAPVHSNAGYGTSHNTATVGNENLHSSNHGPHSSNMANKLDPRVDSDRDGSRTAPGGGDPSYGAPGSTHPTTHGTGLGTSGHTTTHGTGLGSSGHSTTHNTGLGTSGHSTTHGGYDNLSSTNHGPHSSNAANKLDPRVDSDRDGSRTAPGGGDPTYGAPAPGAHNTGLTGSTTGYGSNTAATGVSHTAGSGNANQTAGPHNSNMLNKLDPRVDSDRDGSKTYGGNATYQ